MFYSLGLIGRDISYSKSPHIHTYWLEANGLLGKYRLYDVAEPELVPLITSLSQGKVTGVNVTVPYKAKAFALVDECCPHSQQAQAINTIIHKDGRLLGHNTDVLAAIDMLKPIQPKIACLFGDGGVAKAIIIALRAVACHEIRMVCRRQPQECEPTITYFNWHEQDQALQGADLVVNCTPLGLQGQGNPIDDVRRYNRQATYMDVVYQPRLTPFLSVALEASAHILDGLDLLLRQAQYSFELWTGIFPDITDALRVSLDKQA